MSSIKKKVKAPNITPDVKVAIDIYRQLMPNWVGTTANFPTEVGNVSIEGGIIYQYILDRVRETIQHGKEKTKKGKR